uniref:Inositol polyphosphate-related phosphatase domain-containing protein n=1 Tax=Percolomonas cosmopolitus TaxID=63605 RepID=A0A7S1PGA7_9EUKA|mmetsp:Transcript_1584/g.5465  ORF Transcript_1584/g.5465 Transcript_1584/m.5465 type:complete len:571 (+) Transcript_1584:248-1960(+)
MSTTTSPSNLKIFTGTWNCAEYNPEFETQKLQYDLLRFMQFNKGEENDVYAIGLQEIQMNATSMVKEETIAKTKWQNFFKNLFETGSMILMGRKAQERNNGTTNASVSSTSQSLSQFFDSDESSDSTNPSNQPSTHTNVPLKPIKFKEIACLQLVGILIVVYVKDEHYTRVRNEASFKCREGALGVMGNKGSIACRFKLYDRTFLFICMHLSAHMKNVDQRNQNLNNILQKTAFRIRDVKQVNVLDHDYIFLFGDLNYRIQPIAPDFNDIVQKIQDDNLTYLSSWDQCQTEIRKGTILQGFHEGDILFPPTFKFKIGTDEYNPKRIPSWCDRVFYRATRALLPINQLSYGSSPSVLSDHKPVFALFEVSLSNPLDHSPPLTLSGKPKVKITPQRGTLSFDNLYSSSNMYSDIGGDLPAPLQPQRNISLRTKPRKQSVWGTTPTQQSWKSTTSNSAGAESVSNTASNVEEEKDTPLGEEPMGIPTAQSFMNSEMEGTSAGASLVSSSSLVVDDDPFDMGLMQAEVSEISNADTGDGNIINGHSSLLAPPPPPKKSSHQWALSNSNGGTWQS